MSSISQARVVVLFSVLCETTRQEKRRVSWVVAAMSV